MIAHGDELGRTQRRQQQRLLPGQRDLLGRLGPATTTRSELLDFTAAARPAAPRAPGLPPPPVLRRQRRPRRRERARRHRLVHARRRARWTRRPGATASPGRVMVFLNGQAIPSPDPRGRRVLDDDFLVMFNADHQEDSSSCPSEEWGERWVGRDRHRRRPSSTPTRHAAGSELKVQPRSLIVAAQPARGAAACRPEPPPPPDVTVPSAHRPDPGRAVPTATYRLQVHAGFGFDARGPARAVPVLARRLAPVPVAGAPGGAGLDARLRRARPHPHLRGGRRAARPSRGSSPRAGMPGSASSSTSCPTT